MTAPANDQNLTFQDVLDILRLIDSGPSCDFQVEIEGTRVKVSRRTQATNPHPPAPLPQPIPASESGAYEVAPRIAAETPAAAPASPLAEGAKAVEVKPPMAGTYYSAAAPGVAPFVDVHHAVRKGDQLGIVEVMKLFTPVLSPCDGTVRAILVGDEEFVQSDQTLMVIEAAP
jgi:acetyl-CoA carboxylase biotin carboxyl carrier protein